MRKTKTGPIYALTFLVVLGTGVAVGMFLARLASVSASVMPQGPSGGPGADYSPLAVELQLSAKQQEEMRVIWEATRDRGRQFFDEIRALQEGRDQAMIALLDDKQKTKYEKVAQDYRDRFDTMIARRDASFQEAVEQTKKILDATQREKYERILRTRPPPPKDALPPPVIKGSNAPAAN